MKDRTLVWLHEIDLLSAEERLDESEQEYAVRLRADDDALLARLDAAEALLRRVKDLSGKRPGDRDTNRAARLASICRIVGKYRAALATPHDAPEALNEGGPR